MRNSQDTFETRKRSLTSAFSICMTVPLNEREKTKFEKVLNSGKVYSGFIFHSQIRC